MKRLSKSVSVFFPDMQRLMCERAGMEKRKWKQKKWTIERQILSSIECSSSLREHIHTRGTMTGIRPKLARMYRIPDYLSCSGFLAFPSHFFERKPKNRG